MLWEIPPLLVVGAHKGPAALPAPHGQAGAMLSQGELLFCCFKAEKLKVV